MIAERLAAGPTIRVLCRRSRFFRFAPAWRHLFRFAVTGQQCRRAGRPVRFLPAAQPGKSWKWWCGVIAAGPGWIVIGAVKIMLGSLPRRAGLRERIWHRAGRGTHAYVYGGLQLRHQFIFNDAGAAGIFVVLSQLKINVTNAYAGSIAWSNFFLRLTHRHPGRVVWLFFNVGIALLLMELGVYRAEDILNLCRCGHRGLAAWWRI